LVAWRPLSPGQLFQWPYKGLCAAAPVAKQSHLPVRPAGLLLSREVIPCLLRNLSGLQKWVQNKNRSYSLRRMSPGGFGQGFLPGCGCPYFGDSETGVGHSRGGWSAAAAPLASLMGTSGGALAGSRVASWALGRAICWGVPGSVDARLIGYGGWPFSRLDAGMGNRAICRGLSMGESLTCNRAICRGLSWLPWSLSWAVGAGIPDLAHAPGGSSWGVIVAFTSPWEASPGTGGGPLITHSLRLGSHARVWR